MFGEPNPHTRAAWTVSVAKEFEHTQGKQSSSDMDQPFKWALPDQFAPQWRHWGDESVLFEIESGNTHLIDSVAASLLNELTSRPLSLADLLEIFAEDLPLDKRITASEHLAALLVTLEAKNLVRRVPE